MSKLLTHLGGKISISDKDSLKKIFDNGASGF